jgi:hypothetical protein
MQSDFAAVGDSWRQGSYRETMRRLAKKPDTQSTHLGENVTAERPGKSDASKRRPANNRENFPCRSRFIIGLESLDFPRTEFAVHCWTRAESVDFFALDGWTNFGPW